MLTTVYVVLALGAGIPTLKSPNMKIEGTWKVIANSTSTGFELTKCNQAWTFTRTAATYSTDEKTAMIPCDGACFDLQVDDTVLPPKLSLSFKEDGNTVAFARGVFERKSNTLIIKWAAVWDQIPTDFSHPKKGERSVILILQKQ